MTATVDAVALEIKVKEMYRAVAQDPHGRFHFELGRGLARQNPYGFISDQARGASGRYGVKSISLLARKP